MKMTKLARVFLEAVPLGAVGGVPFIPAQAAPVPVVVEAQEFSDLPDLARKISLEVHAPRVACDVSSSELAIAKADIVKCVRLLREQIESHPNDLNESYDREQFIANMRRQLNELEAAASDPQTSPEALAIAIDSVERVWNNRHEGSGIRWSDIPESAAWLAGLGVVIAGAAIALELLQSGDDQVGIGQ